MKLKLLFTASYLIINTLTSIAQLSVKVVNEDFSNNMMRWDIVDNELSEMDLTNGKYNIRCKKNGTAITSTIDVPHLQFSNFRITASLSKLKGIDDNGFGLVWGGKDENNELEFVVSGNGQFKVTKWEQGAKTDIVPWTYSSAINKWDFSKNILMIESFENLTRYYINDKYVAASEDLPHLGSRVGFVLNESMQVEVDNIVVENLSPGIGKKYGSPQNVKIKSVSFSGTKSADKIYYNETGYLKIELENANNLKTKDLALKINPAPITGLEYNPVTMVEEIDGNESKTILIKFVADEEIASQQNNFDIQLISFNKMLIDKSSINVESVGLSSYYSENTSKDQPNNENTNPYYNKNTKKQNNNNNNTSDACTKGCSGAGFLALLVGLVLAIL